MTEEKECLKVVFNEDDSIGVEFADEFLDSSTEEQLQMITEFFWKKTLEPSPDFDVSREA